VGNRNTVDVKLGSDVTGLSEVVVIGYGTQNKRDLTGSVSSIKGDQIASLPIQSFDQALQGRAAGVNITTPNGVVGNPPVIRVRGVNSINLSSYPLIVIDGVPTFTADNSTNGNGGLSSNSAANNPLANLNPADIESIEVLKDASARRHLRLPGQRRRDPDHHQAGQERQGPHRLRRLVRLEPARAPV
jgi:outer membrane receptor for ferrienterochelin and colicin